MMQDKLTAHQALQYVLDFAGHLAPPAFDLTDAARRELALRCSYMRDEAVRAMGS